MVWPLDHLTLPQRRRVLLAAACVSLLLTSVVAGVLVYQRAVGRTVSLDTDGGSAVTLQASRISGRGAGKALPSSVRSRTAVARIRPVLKTRLNARGLRLGAPVFIRIFKEPRELELWMKGGKGWVLYKTFPVCRYSGALGPKLKEGDGQSPEGLYRVGAGQLNPDSSYHLSFNLGFPNAWDRGKGRTGSFLMVHGDCVSIGCYAMTDAGIEEIWTLVTAALRAGQPAFQVHVFPFRLESAAMTTHRQHRSLAFWRELQPCYAKFVDTRVPPRVRVRGGKYVCS